MPLTGHLSYFYWGWNATWKSGNPASDKHLPFNPMQNFPVPKVRPQQERITTADKLYPNIEWTSKRTGEEVTITTFYRDPLLMQMFFTDRTVTAAWTGTGDSIVYTLGDRSEETFMWMQVHIHDHDGSNHQDLFFDGGDVTSYSWSWNAGELLKEEITILFAEVTESEYAVDIDDGLDDGSFDRAGIDGGWSLWDGAYSSTQGVHSSDLAVTWGGASISDVAIVSGSMTLTKPVTHEHLSNSLTPGIRFETGAEPYTAQVEGFLNDDENYTEFINDIDSKTTGTFKVQYGTTKYLQFTNAYVNDYNIQEVSASDAVRITLNFLGGAGSVPTFSWTANEATDPSSYIEHTNP